MVALRWLQPLRVVASWLLDDTSCAPTARRVLSSLAFTLFVSLAIVGAIHHQIWRDEARALTIALEPEHWWGLAKALENEGHPALWHLLLRLAHGIVASPNVLQWVTLAIGIAAAALLFCRAPLPTWWRVAFLFGWVPLFEGAVLCRNYGISMLLLFAFSAVARSLRPVLAASMLALLANTNVYGAMMACGLGVFLALECVRRKLSAPVVAAVVLVSGAGIAVSVWTTWPTAESKIAGAANYGPLDALVMGLRALVGFSTNTDALFGFAPLAWGVVMLAVVATLCIPHLAFAVLAVFLAAAWFMRGVYGAGAHHLGMLFVFLAAVTWIRAAHGTATPTTRSVRVAWRTLLFGVWPLLLLFQGYRGLREIYHEVVYTKTSAPELARLLDRSDLTGAVLIGEPDYYLDAMPYYLDNRVFIAREGRFGRRVSWTTANQRDLDLGQLLAAARALPRDDRAPVLFVIGHPIRLDQPDGDVTHGYGDRFRWSAAQQADFFVATEHIASLPARPGRFRGDERYELYRLRK